MKHFVTLAALLTSLVALAQNPLTPNFPFPYNPDGNADGYIGLNDMLDLLSVYGQEYPESFYGDSTGAVLFLGDKTPGGCQRAAKLAGPKWRVLTTTDYYNWDIILASHFAEQWDQITSTYFYFHVADKDGDFNAGQYFLSTDPTTWLNSLEGGEGYFDGVASSSCYVYSSNNDNFVYVTPKQCILVTEVYPQIEYHIIRGTQEAVQAEVTDSISNGWRLNGGISAYSSGNFMQAIWKYAE